MHRSISFNSSHLLRAVAVVLTVCGYVAAQSSDAAGISTRSAPSSPVAKASGQLSPTHFRVGEKLRYNISWGRFINAAYAEMSVVSRGTLNGRDAIELHSRLKTIELVNAAILQLDQARQVFVAPDTGLPLYATKRDNTGFSPKETSVDYMKGDAASFDLLSLIYKVREAGGTGTFTLFEDEKLFTVTFQPGKNERVITQAGQFDTVICAVESDYLTGKGIKDLKINFTSDAEHVPVLFRMKTSKGDFRAALATLELPATTQTAPVALATAAPLPQPTAKPKPTAPPYIPNQPLAPELGFDLGETLEYSVSIKGTPIAVITLSAKERRLFQNEDSLLLAATVMKADPSHKAFVTGDQITTYVDPETLAPRYLGASFSGGLAWLNGTLTFDARTGSYSLNSGPKMEAPMGTHTVLSLIYAMRSFNLKPSKDPSNPVNDTRVSVFWEKQPYIFTLRPTAAETIVINGQKVSVQLVKATTGNAEIDAAAPRVWLSDDRVPVRFAIGPYQADLTTVINK